MQQAGERQTAGQPRQRNLAPRHEQRAALQDLDPQVLGLAGGLSTGDAGGTEVAERVQTPIVNTPISTTFEKVSTVFDINPPFADVNAVIGKYR